MAINSFSKKCIVFTLSFVLAAGVMPFAPAKKAYAAGQTLKISTCRSLALNASTDYESAEMKVDSKQASRQSALKALQLKQKDMSSFRWSPLLSFKFPTKPNFAQASQFALKPLTLQADIESAQHKMQDTIFSINEKVNNLYVDIVTKQEAVAFGEERLKSLTEGYERNNERLKIGEATKGDVDKLKKQKESVEKKLASDKRDLQAKLKKMSKLLGLDVTTGYKFEIPFVEAEIGRDKLDKIIQYAEDRDQTYYDACMAETVAKMTLRTNYSLMAGQYGGDMGYISSYVSQALAGGNVNKRAFKKSYDAFIDKIDSYWRGSIRIIFFKFPKEWFKGDMDGVRYIEDDPYTLYNNVLDCVQASTDRKGAKENLDSSVTDSFENYVSVKNSFKSLQEDVSKQKAALDKYKVLNQMGEMTFDEYNSAQTDYEEAQNSMLDAMSLYTTSLYSFDRLTCGGVSSYFKGTDVDLKTAVVGESSAEKGDGAKKSEAEEEKKEGVRYYIKSIIQSEEFELSIYVPDGFPVALSDYELWVDKQQVGKRMPITETIRHLTLAKENAGEVKIRFYNGSSFVDDCVIDPKENSGTLSIVSSRSIKTTEPGLLGEYSVDINEKTGIMKVTLTPDESLKIAKYIVRTGDGIALGSDEPQDIKKAFTHLSMVETGLSELSIEFYGEDTNLIAKGHFDTTNKQLKRD
ncbi:MAG: TolC family protein [Lachnospiraceae bacterium]|nr:TolC family protein [Lachnospiraceae bacterium]